MKKIKSRFMTRILFIFISVLLTALVIGYPKEINANTNGHSQQEAVNWANDRYYESYGEDTDGNGLWCTDLINAYCDWLGVSRFSGNAYMYQYANLSSDSNKDGWTMDNTPRGGDIVVWNPYTRIAVAGYTTEQYGHVGIVTEVKGDVFTYVDTRQNTSCGVFDDYVSDPAIFIHPNFVSADTEAPTASHIQFVEFEDNKFTIYCMGATDNVGIARVVIYVWTQNVVNGTDQDDLHWYEGTYNSENGGWWVHVPYSDHNNEMGVYIAHAYVYDAAGNQTVIAGSCNIEKNPPTISDAKITNIDSTGYTISCNVTDDTGVTRVAFPTFGPGESNAFWKDGTQNGDTWTVRINDSDHNFQKGNYVTHIYAYDNMGNLTLVKMDEQSVSNNGKSVAELSYNGHQYLLYDDYLTWKDAEAFCETKGGHLVTITSSEEQSAVQSLITRGNRGSYCIGLSDEVNEGDFEWVTGESLTYTNWQSGEPSNYGGAENWCWICHSTDTLGLWNDYSGEIYSDCGIGFILEIENTEINPVATTTYKGNRYAIYNALMTWDEAQAFCEEKGGHLVTITSEEEQTEIENLVASGASNQMSGYYIGLERNASNGFEWITGEVLSYNNWASGQPDNDRNVENKGGLFYNCFGYVPCTWNDYSETANNEGYTIGFIMEIEAVIKGDINQDGFLTIEDANLAKRIAMKTATESEYTTEGFNAGDLDGNGKITINEARKIKREVLTGIEL